MAVYLKLAKLLGVLLYVSGSLGVATSSNFEDKKRFAAWLSGPGFLMTWGFGVSLTQVAEVPIFSTWILGAMGCSLLSMNGVLWTAAKEGRGGWRPGLVIALPLLVAVTLMVLRPA